MRNHKQLKDNPASVKAVPFFGIVKTFAHLAGLPFLTYNDQLQAIGLYNNSILNAARHEG